MAKEGPTDMPAKKDAHPDRKAHANLAQVEGQILAGLRHENPALVEEDGSCPQCVALEHALADEYQAQATASELTGGS